MVAVVAVVLVPVLLFVPVTVPADAPRGAEVRCGIPVRETERAPDVYRDGEFYSWGGGEYNIICRDARERRRTWGILAAIAALLAITLAGAAWRGPEWPRKSDD